MFLKNDNKHIITEYSSDLINAHLDKILDKNYHCFI